MKVGITFSEETVCESINCSLIGGKSFTLMGISIGMRGAKGFVFHNFMQANTCVLQTPVARISIFMFTLASQVWTGQKRRKKLNENDICKTLKSCNYVTVHSNIKLFR